MSVNKIIKFYVMEPAPAIYFNGTMKNFNNCAYLIFKSAFANSEDYYSFNYDKKNLFFDIKEFNENNMFGTCSVIENIQATSFMQQRNKHTNKTKPFTTVNSEEQLETYTFFYVDFPHNRMAVIANKKISKIHEAISAFIWEKSSKVAKINIAPEKIDNPKEAANSLKDLSKFQLEFFTPHSFKNIQPLRESLGKDFELEKYDISFKIKKAKKEFIDTLFAFREKASSEGISKITLTGKNDLGIDETLNLIETLYTKAVPFYLTDDSAVNIEYIKNRLQEFLDIHIMNDHLV